MPTRYTRRLYPYRRTTGSSRAYSFPWRQASASRSRGTYRGYGSYYAALAPYAIRAAPYIRAGYKAYRRGGYTGLKRYAGSLASAAASNAIRTVTGYGAYSGMRGGMQGKTIPKSEMLDRMTDQ